MQAIFFNPNATKLEFTVKKITKSQTFGNLKYITKESLG